ncbi:MAG: TIGR04211 family SH3 domain-containing protein [Gammaproteobacteria bacterium]|nr:TIGR04211 family SH3 domain-containing protein [Gammaproteobacteria bacterium]MDH5778850.1 TIGR04211 family SH3 domain-containing protein [Gammaproteobacteria bacterium]
MKKNKTRYLLASIVTFLISGQLSAAQMYVTDRIMLGVHQEADTASSLVTSVPTGTVVQTGDTSGDFTKVTLPNGDEGWVNTGYLRKDKPAAAELDALYAQYQKTVVTLKEVNTQLTKKEREWQLWRDEAINTRNAIKALKNKMANGGTIEVDTEAAEKLKDAEKELSQLKTQNDQLGQELEKLKALNQNDMAGQLQKFQNENIGMKTRIEAALANLEGRTVPTPEELAAIRPKFPIWYTLLVILIGVLGAGAGIAWMDYKHRRRHGGFRL